MDETPRDLLLPPGSRLFTLEEANAMLPHLEALFGEMDGRMARATELRELMEDLDAYYGDDILEPDNPEGATFAAHKGELTEVLEELQALADGVAAMGVLLKDPQTGLVDFYHLRGGELVFLCWQRGEPAITHYHSLEGGYAGRRPLGPSP